MNKSTPIIFAVLGLLAACNKSSNNNSTINTTNIAGSYKLSALVYTNGGLSFNVYDSLDACEKDDIIKLNTNLTADFIDAGLTCTPPDDASGNWSLSNDSLYIGANSGKIKSFDGKTLVLLGHPSVNGFLDLSTTATTTLTKQ